MSILLSEKEQFRAKIDAIGKYDKPTDENIFTCELEAQARKVVQYLEGLCPNVSHESIHFECKRVNCPDCMKQIHEELGI